MNLLSPFVSNFLMLGFQRRPYGKWAATGIAFLFLIVGYILGCIGLYHYLVPQWGQAFSLLTVGAVCLASSLLFFALRYFMKPKTASWAENAGDFEKNFVQFLQQFVKGEAVLKKIRPYITLKSLGMVVLITAVLSAYFGNKKE